MLPTAEREANVQLVPPHLTGLVLGAAGGGARFVSSLQPAPAGRDKAADARGRIRAGPGRSVPTASGRAPGSSGSGGSGISGWLRGSSALRISFRAGLGGIGMGIGAGGMVRRWRARWQCSGRATSPHEMPVDDATPGMETRLALAL
jgi:hypothetical protein